MTELIRNKANLLLDSRAALGEGPVWDWQKQVLYWVDIEGCMLHQHSPSSGENKSWTFDEMIGAAVPMEDGNLLLAMETGLASFNPENEQSTKLGVLQNSDPKIRFNDGKIGPNGHFWIGTMDKSCAPRSGNFYRVAPDLQYRLQIQDTSVSNGMAWSSDHVKFYYIDSPTFEVKAFVYDVLSGSISDGRTAFRIPKECGSPDGMSIDEEDMLWIAHWGGHCVRRWNPDTGEVLEKIDVDAPQVTSCCFGGKDLDTLFITTARSGLTDEQLEEFPQSGGLFFHRTTVRGTPINYFKHS